MLHARHAGVILLLNSYTMMNYIDHIELTGQINMPFYSFK